MSDTLETVLKETIKRIMAEAIAEAAAGGKLMPAMAAQSPVAAMAAAAPSVPCPTIPGGPVGWERFIFGLKSLALGGFALGMCGFASNTLFPTDDAMAAQDAAWMQQVHQEAQAQKGHMGHWDGGNWVDYGYHRRPYIDPKLLDINDPNDPDVAACMAEDQQDIPTKLTWADLADPAKLKAMYKHNAFLHAQPEDLTAIVIFFELSKMAKGEAIHLQDIPADFKNALPCAWRPAFDAVTAHVPQPLPMLPMPKDFIGPFAQYYN